MAVFRDQAFPLTDYPEGVYSVPQRLIENSVTVLYFEIKRCTSADLTIWPNENQQIQYDQEISFDNGQTWIYGGGFGASGGIFLKRDGNELGVSSFRINLRAPDGNKKRRLRSTIEIINGPIRTEGFIELID